MMKTKEKLRFALAIVFSGIFGFFSVLIIDAAVAEFFMMPSKMTETFYGFALFAVMMAALALLLIGIGTVCTGALGAFMAFSLRKHASVAVRTTAKVIFVLDLIFIAIDVLSLMLLLL